LRSAAGARRPSSSWTHAPNATTSGASTTVRLVWWYVGGFPNVNTALCTPRRSAAIDSDCARVTHSQLLQGSTM
jgi:hypothetical protein